MPQRDIALPPDPKQGRPATWQDLITAEAKAVGVPSALALSVAEKESTFNPLARGAAGEIGLMQLMPQTAKDLQVDPNDPIQNIRGGIKYLKQQLDASGGDVQKALSAYNAGPRGGNRPEYVQDVLSRLGKFSTTGTPSTVRTSTSTEGPAGATAPPPRPSFLQDILSNISPMNPVGRRNLMGAAGAAVAVPAAAAIGVPAGIGLATAGVLGAMGGGGIQEAFESLTGPPKPGSVIGRVGEAMTQQGMYEMGGQVFLWPFRAAGRRLAATPIGKHAKVTLDKAFEGLTTRLKQSAAGVPIEQAGSMVHEVAEGPAKESLKSIGRNVTEVAKTGPNIPTVPLAKRLQELSAERTPTFLTQGEAGVTTIGGRQFTIDQAKQILARNPDAIGLAQIPQELHLPAALSIAEDAVQSGPSISFNDAHIVKRLLDDVINWDKPSMKMKATATQGFRSTLRQLMSVHEPYNEATAIYEEAVPLFRKGLIPKLARKAVDDPGSLVQTIRHTDTPRIKMLKSVLLGHATAGGGQAEGEAAWDAVRAAWTREKLIKGPTGTLMARIEKMSPTFTQEMFGDETGATILGRIQRIADTWQQTLEKNVRLKESSLAVSRDVATTAADIARITLAPTSSYGVTSGARLVLHGPKIPDLIEWAAFSKEPWPTQLLIKALTSPTPGMALADLMRVANLIDPEAIKALAGTETSAGPPKPQSSDLNLSISGKISGPPPAPR